MKNNAVEKILKEVLKKIKPNKKERQKILGLAEKIKSNLKKELEKANLTAEIRVEGSVAKDTWLSENPDIDVFVRFSTDFPKERFRTDFLQMAKRATKGAKHIERFAEHPYLEAVVNAVRVNIVPCYASRPKEWKSATDRTPYHTDYVKKLLNEQLCDEIRLLKKFMQGIGVYGAEIKIGGFSGYLCELLTINYGSFRKVLENFAEWKKGLVIDLEKYYEGRETDLNLMFKEPLIVVDPVDESRNVAAAVRREHLYEFIAASRQFLRNPSIKYFYPPETVPLGREKLIQSIRERGTTLTFLKIGCIEAVPDILWGQIYKSQRSLRKLFKQYEYKLIRDAVWSDEKNSIIMIFEFESGRLPSLKKHLGPPLAKTAECQKFLSKHINSKERFSGPYIEDGRWIVEVRRKYPDVTGLLREKLRNGGKNAGMASLIAEGIKREFKIYLNEEIVDFYVSNEDFAKFLTDYLDGRPKWLR
ncbi:CCA tRNA nucleotidyltransferase [Candidatus Bathyarchaeota archaeon]|nr:CCA tRNA nucleotidyltransferase [Candidatus Bathyarchaeota archaeon]